MFCFLGNSKPMPDRPISDRLGDQITMISLTRLALGTAINTGGISPSDCEALYAGLGLTLLELEDIQKQMRKP